MRIAFFSAKPYDKTFFNNINQRYNYTLCFFEHRLTGDTATLAQGFPVVCAFVNDTLDEHVLRQLKQAGVQYIALRSAGYNHVDVSCAQTLGLKLTRVPTYSPHAVAEHTFSLILSLNRHIHRAYNRVREGNFALDGLLGFDLHGKTFGLIGMGKIGSIVANIAHGFGCKIIAHDPVTQASSDNFIQYLPFSQVIQQANILSLHCPLTPSTHHFINEPVIQQMQPGVMLINTSRGALIDTQAVIQALKTGHIGALGLDVYEEEADLFFEDLSGKILQDDIFSRLLTFPNVLITGHQAFFTQEALTNIASTTMENIHLFAQGLSLVHQVPPMSTPSP